jgi:hypothetical protein
MSGKILHNPGRRSFLLAAAPACALAYLTPQRVYALAQEGKGKPGDETVHKFDNEFERKMTIRQYFDSRYREYISLAKDIEKEWGHEKTLEFLKKRTAEQMTEYGKLQAGQVEDNDFEAYVSQFRDGYKDILTMEIVEDTETAFELKVTQCIWADTFLRADAGDIGFCSVCWGDYYWPTGFNERITMVRDKTLMEGHDICNHRYLWKG